MYNEEYKDFKYKGVRFGDFINGVSKKGVIFQNAQLTTVGGGTLGVWVKGEPIEFSPENGGDTIVRGTVKLERRATAEEIKVAGGCPLNEAVYNIKVNKNKLLWLLGFLTNFRF